MSNLVSLLSGLIFGLGLMIAQMVNPNKIIQYLDITGKWDPSLAFVMAGALLVFGLGYAFLIKPRARSLDDSVIAKVNSAPIDGQLIIGSSLFGIGWGLIGLCPGPTIANLSSLNPMIWTFFVVMIMGLMIGNIIKKVTLKVASPRGVEPLLPG